MNNSEMTYEQLWLMKNGFLMCRDGTLIRWTPTFEQPPIENIMAKCILHEKEVDIDLTKLKISNDIQSSSRK
jgi:hypothetical protein